MQDQGQIARAFAAWQRAHQRFIDAEHRLAAATQAFQQGRAPRPDALHEEMLTLKAAQDSCYAEAAESLRSSRIGPSGTGGAVAQGA